MNHLTEEQLILFHYDEAEDHRALKEHFASCDLCRSRYQDLDRALSLLGGAPVPERPEDYGREVWTRLRPRRPERPGETWAWIFAPRRWALGGAMAAVIVAAFFAGRFWPRHAAPPAEAAIPAQARERILLVAVGDHLEKSQMVLVELENADGNGPVDISPERHLARDLVDSNRLYREAALRDGDVGVASVLDDLERVLIEIANSPSKISSAQLQEIQRRIEAKGILFKIRVVGSQVEERGKSAAPQRPGGNT
jgi:hypothetical protein